MLLASALVRHEINYLVAERLGGDDSDLLDDPLVGVEVQGQLGVVFLDDDSSSLLDGLGSDAAHLYLLCKGRNMINTLNKPQHLIHFRDMTILLFSMID